MNASVINFTPNNILVFESDTKYSQKILYNYMPKLIKLLNKVSSADLAEALENYPSDSEFTDQINQLIAYIKESLTPELTFRAYLHPGDYIACDPMKYIYVVSILKIRKKITLAVDRLDIEELPMINKDLYIQVINPDNRISERFSSFVSKLTISSGKNIKQLSSKYRIAKGIEVGPRKAGNHEDCFVYNWVLTRHPFSYIQVDTRSVKDKINNMYKNLLYDKHENQKNGNNMMMWAFIFLVIFIIVVVAIGLIWTFFISRDRTEPDQVVKREVEVRTVREPRETNYV